MIARYSDPNALELAGDSDELERLRSEISKSSFVEWSEGLRQHDPAPYSLALERLLIRSTEGPVQVIVIGAALRITGSRENLSRFATFLSPEPGGHQHFEYYDGNHYVDSKSLPVVVSCTSAT